MVFDPIKETTTASSVGGGLVRPLGSPMSKEAEEFYRRWGMVSYGVMGSTLRDFAKARNFSEDQVSELKEILHRKYSIAV